jgi:hypothetical protein
MLLLLTLSVVSSFLQWQILPIENPKDLWSVIPLILFVWWGLVNLVGVFVSLVILVIQVILRIKSKYREGFRAYKFGLPCKFPTLFRFIKWLNTDD